MRQQQNRERSRRRKPVAPRSRATSTRSGMAEGARYASKEDTRRAARAYREVIAQRPDPTRPRRTNYNLCAALGNSRHFVEAAQRFLEAKERHPVGSKNWAKATAYAFNMLRQEACDEKRRGGQARVVERRGAQGTVGERCEGGAERSGSQQHAGYGAVGAV